MAILERIDVSHEMLTFVGSGQVEIRDAILAPILLTYNLSYDAVSSVTLHPDAAGIASSHLAFLVSRDACQRLFPAASLAGGKWHLPTDMRAIAADICRGPGTSQSRSTLQLAKSIELFHATMSALEEGSLVAVAADLLSLDETERIIAANRFLDERWREAPTLDVIARAAGISRSQLTRGFRLVFACTVGDALARNRLNAAKDMILQTDVSIARIGFQCGYRNAASFSRAFSRRFGKPPGDLRKD